MTNPFLKIHNLSFAYPGPNNPWILSAFNLSAQAGELVGLAGPSGLGKSTLLRLIAGLEKPLVGQIHIDGRLVASESVHVNPEDRQVGLVFQDYGLFPHLTVAQNIAYGLFKLPKKLRKQKVDQTLALIRMTELANRHPYELSGGQQQRAALARSLAPGPKLLLLDEPLSNLDTDLKTEIRAEMRLVMEKSQATVLFVSHDLEDLKAVCQRVEFMK
ncbi:MAG: ABC transporter ATP-binding protein [Deltaproteobacteria bacterium]|nr:ABC transporter ATP-binding protein [Deltaproteobacteria bacterium]